MWWFWLKALSAPGSLSRARRGALAILLGVADAQQGRARAISQVERDRSAATQEAERLRAQANDARTEVAALNTRLSKPPNAAARRKPAVADAETRLVALHLRAAADGARYRRDRDSLESAIMAAAFAHRRVDPAATRAGVFARAAAPTLSTGSARARARWRKRAGWTRPLRKEQEILTAAQEAIDAEPRRCSDFAGPAPRAAGIPRLRR
ncbi:MAG: hypothetical protein WDM79_00275 [Terricaulis sp.]